MANYYVKLIINMNSFILSRQFILRPEYSNCDSVVNRNVPLMKSDIHFYPIKTV